MNGALERYFQRKKGLYSELNELALKNNAFSKKVLALSEKDFKKLYKATIKEIKESLPDESVEYLPSYDGWGIHTIKEVRIEYKDNKFEVQTGKKKALKWGVHKYSPTHTHVVYFGKTP